MPSGKNISHDGSSPRFRQGTVRVHVYGQPVDMRKSFDGLYALTRHALGLDPLSGALFVFINRRGSQVKVLYWDRSGFCIWGKRLERGCFVSDWSQMKSCEIDWTQFKLMLEGFVVTRQRLRYNVARITREAA
ncbi:MAG: IS66 family insertion sequence element accessory protein TnpB [Burkholderiaceae bacterium]|nr:MAG: IS66 family insertion sequence element accessory protein TnpB [Burkholderiaceae bacterium]